MLAGNFAAAVPSLQKSIALEPHANTYSNLGLIHYYLGQLDEAIGNQRKAIKLAPNDHLMWSNLGDALWISGNIHEAREAFETAEELVTSALQVNPNYPYSFIDLAWISAMLDKHAEARALIERARAAELDDPYLHYIDGLILLRSGDTDPALSALELAAENGYSLQMMAAEPHLASIRGNPRFRAILDRM
jgi:tetratricopeptide (TPR) repeat protein